MWHLTLPNTAVHQTWVNNCESWTFLYCTHQPSLLIASIDNSLDWSKRTTEAIQIHTNTWILLSHPLQLTDLSATFPMLWRPLSFACELRNDDNTKQFKTGWPLNYHGSLCLRRYPRVICDSDAEATVLEVGVRQSLQQHSFPLAEKSRNKPMTCARRSQGHRGVIKQFNRRNFHWRHEVLGWGIIASLDAKWLQPSLIFVSPTDFWTKTSPRKRLLWHRQVSQDRNKDLLNRKMLKSLTKM